MVLAHPELLDIFMHTTPTFNWRPNFPERGLDAVLRDVHYRFPKWRRKYEEGPDPTMVMTEVVYVRDKLHELGLSKDEVLARLEVMGMIEYWRAMVAYAGEPPERDDEGTARQPLARVDEGPAQDAGVVQHMVFQDDSIRLYRN